MLPALHCRSIICRWQGKGDQELWRIGELEAYTARAILVALDILMQRGNVIIIGDLEDYTARAILVAHDMMLAFRELIQRMNLTECAEFLRPADDGRKCSKMSEDTQLKTFAHKAQSLLDANTKVMHSIAAASRALTPINRFDTFSASPCSRG